MRIIVFGDGAWAANSLERLAATHEIAAVVLRHHPSGDALEAAACRRGIPVLHPEKVNAPEFLDHLRLLAPDVNLSIAYNQILRDQILAVAPKGFINFHAGKLPFYRGRNIINWAIINGEQEIGLTAHYVDEGVDTGDIILQRVLPIHWTDTYGDVLDRVFGAFPDLVFETLELIAQGTAPRIPQRNLPGTYFGGRQQGDEWLDWHDTSLNLYNKIRAISRPGPGARTLLGRREVIVWQVTYQTDWPKYLAIPGQVVGRNASGVLVKTGDSTLLVREIQIDSGEAEVPRWAIGTRLGLDMLARLSSMAVRGQRPE